MSGWEIWVLLGVMVPAFAVLLWLMIRQNRSAVERQAWLERSAVLEQALTGAFHKANADMAARVEQIKGDLRTDLAERLHQGLGNLREGLDRQLASGRDEQSQRLAQTVAALEKKFDQLSEAQAQSARQARGELAQSLGETTQALGLRFAALEQKTAQSLEAIRANVDAKLVTLGDQVQQKLDKNIREGFAHFQKVQEHLQAAELQLRHVGLVGQSINELNSLLKLPHLRGKFGEAELARLLADFLPASAFAEQVILVPGSKEAVDAVVKFPKFLLPIDSKFNREQVLPLFETSDPEALKAAREQLAVTIKAQARAISEKYIHPEHGTTDLALMFLPSETLYFEVIRNGELCDAIHKLKVFPVSPNTLAITLRAVAMSISQYEFAKGVEKTLEELGAAQRSFGHFQKRFEEVGRGLEKAQEAYNTATGHLNRYTNRVGRLTGETVPEIAEGETPQA
jgi:DNA recombination protein RmuC